MTWHECRMDLTDVSSSSECWLCLKMPRESRKHVSAAPFSLSGIIRKKKTIASSQGKAVSHISGTKRFSTVRAGACPRLNSNTTLCWQKHLWWAVEITKITERNSDLFTIYYSHKCQAVCNKIVFEWLEGKALDARPRRSIHVWFVSIRNNVEEVSRPIPQGKPATKNICLGFCLAAVDK